MHIFPTAIAKNFIDAASVFLTRMKWLVLILTRRHKIVAG